MKAILYAAKSTVDERGSIPAQIADCKAMAERNGWTVEAIYSDEAASAWSGNRGAGLADAMEHAERIAPCALIVQHTDRLARGDGVKGRHLGELHFWSIKLGIEIHSVQDDDTFNNPLLAFVMGERNAEDSRRKSLAVKDGMKRRRQAGKPHGGPRPYGYRYEDGGLVIVEAEAAIVRRIFAEYVAGGSQLAITRRLQREEVPTLRGGEWHQGTVRGMLANPIYAGRVGEVDGIHQAVVDDVTWGKAQKLRGAKATMSGPGRPPAGQHLFRKGMLRCECGGAMVPRTARNRKGEKVETYRCYNRHRDLDACSMPPQRRVLIDTAVYKYFESVGLDLEATRKQLGAEQTRKVTEVRALREDAERELQRAVDRLARVRRDYTDGKISADDWNDFQADLTAERDAADESVKRLRKSEAEIEIGGEIVDAERQTLERLAAIRRAVAGEIRDQASVDAARAAITRLFDRFILHPADQPKLGRRHRDDPIPDGPPIAPLIDATGLLIEVHLRDDVLVGFGDGLVPILRREPLNHAADNYGVGLTT